MNSFFADDIEPANDAPTEPETVPTVVPEVPAPAETPVPTETPAPSETPAPVETPAPTETPTPIEKPELPAEDEEISTDGEDGDGRDVVHIPDPKKG